MEADNIVDFSHIMNEAQNSPQKKKKQFVNILDVYDLQSCKIKASFGPQKILSSHFSYELTLKPEHSLEFEKKVYLSLGVFCKEFKIKNLYLDGKPYKIPKSSDSTKSNYYMDPQA